MVLLLTCFGLIPALDISLMDVKLPSSCLKLYKVRRILRSSRELSFRGLPPKFLFQSFLL